MYLIDLDCDPRIVVRGRIVFRHYVQDNPRLTRILK